MTSKHIIVAVGMALIAVPASAAENSATAAKGDKSASVDQKKYCLSYDSVVGSRVRASECKTKAEWARQRVDVDKMLKE